MPEQFANLFQLADQSFHIGPANSARAFANMSPQGFVNAANKRQAFGRNPRDHHPAILLASFPRNQPARFQTVEQAGNVRIVIDHAFRNLAAGGARWLRAAQDAQHVVLSGGKIEPAAMTSLIGQLEQIRENFQTNKE